MAVKAVGWANDTRLNDQGQLHFEIQVTILDGTLGGTTYTCDPTTGRDMMCNEMMALVRSYAEDTMGQSFDSGDDIRLFVQYPCMMRSEMMMG